MTWPAVQKHSYGHPKHTLFTSSQSRCLTRFSAVMEGASCPQSLSLLGMASKGLLPQALQCSDQASQPSALARLSTITTSKQSSFLLRHYLSNRTLRSNRCSRRAYNDPCQSSKMEASAIGKHAFAAVVRLPSSTASDACHCDVYHWDMLGAMARSMVQRGCEVL